MSLEKKTLPRLVVESSNIFDLNVSYRWSGTSGGTGGIRGGTDGISGTSVGTGGISGTSGGTGGIRGGTDGISGTSVGTGGISGTATFKESVSSFSHKHVTHRESLAHILLPSLLFLL